MVWLTAIAAEAWRHSTSALIPLLVSVVVVWRISHRGVISPAVCPTTSGTTREVTAAHAAAGLRSSVVANVTNVRATSDMW